MIKEQIYRLTVHLINQGLVEPKVVSHDRSLLRARGALWHKRYRRQGIEPKKPFDREANWGYSETKKEWIYGYGIHLSVISSPRTPVVPLFAELTTAENKGLKVLESKLDKLPKQTKYLIADAEYDSKKLYLRSKQRLLTPIRKTVNRYTRENTKMSAQRKRREAFFKSKKGKRLYRLRSTSVEPMFNIIKHIFRVEPSWFFGKNYTETLILLTCYTYQIMVAYTLYHNLPRQRICKIKPFLDRI